METGNYHGALTKDAGLAIRDNSEETPYFFIVVQVTHKVEGNKLVPLDKPLKRTINMDVVGEYWPKNKALLEELGFDGSKHDAWKSPKFSDKLYTEGVSLYCKVSEKNGKPYWYINSGSSPVFTHTPAPDKTIDHWVRDWTGGGNGHSQPAPANNTSGISVHFGDAKKDEMWTSAVKNLGSEEAVKAAIKKNKKADRISPKDVTYEDIWKVVEDSSAPQPPTDDEPLF